MKKMLILVFVLLLSFSTSAFADSETKSDNKQWTEQQVTKRLLDLGFNEEQISYLNWESKIEIVKDKEAKKLLSFKRSGYSFEDGKLTENNGDFSTLALQDDLYLNVIAMDYGTTNGHPYLKIVADYNWSNMPYYRLYDGFAISWSEGWYGNSWGFTDSQQYCTYYEHGCQSYAWKSYAHNTPKDEDRLAGVGWTYDLLGNSTDAKGTAYAYLIGNDESKIKSTTYSAFKAWYGHDQLASNIGVSIGLPRGAGLAAGVSFGEEETTSDSTSIYNPGLTW